MSSRINMAPADGRSFTQYASSGLYNNYLEKKFGVKSPTEYRHFIQENSKQVIDATSTLTAIYIDAPAMPQSIVDVVGVEDTKLMAAPVDFSQKILTDEYHKW